MVDRIIFDDMGWLALSLSEAPAHFVPVKTKLLGPFQG